MESQLAVGVWFPRQPAQTEMQRSIIQSVFTSAALLPAVSLFPVF